MYRHLFFDDTRLLKRENLKREYGRPVVSSSYVDSRVSCGYCWAWGIQGIDGRIYLLYFGFLDNTATKVAALAVSEDGISFVPAEIPPDARPAEAILPNQLDIPAIGGSEIAAVFQDPLAPPEQRYAMLFTDYSVLKKEYVIHDYVLTSPDLIHWTRLENSCWNPIGTEPVTGCFHNPLTQKNTILTRPDWGQRRMAITETTDWHHFTPIELCMQADSEDPPLAELYGMTALVYDNFFIGFPHIYDNFPPSLTAKFHGGTIGTQLAYSLNGRHWQRSLRQSFVGPELDLGDGLWQMTFITSFLRQNDDSWLLYAGSTRTEHGCSPAEIHGHAAVRIFRLRKDGFICLSTEHPDQPSVLALREAVWNGGTLAINLKAVYATCAIYDTTDGGEPVLVRSHEDCLPFRGDTTHWTPQWKSGSLDEFRKRTLIVELRMTRGSLFSIEYDAIPLMNCEGMRYKATGRAQWHPGF